jgi:hypothetical protein
MRWSCPSGRRGIRSMWVLMWFVLVADPWAAAQSQPQPTRRTTTVGYLYGFNWNDTESRRDVVTFDFTESSRWGDQYAFST